MRPKVPKPYTQAQSALFEVISACVDKAAGDLPTVFKLLGLTSQLGHITWDQAELARWLTDPAWVAWSTERSALSVALAKQTAGRVLEAAVSGRGMVTKKQAYAAWISTLTPRQPKAPPPAPAVVPPPPERKAEKSTLDSLYTGDGGKKP